VDDRQRFNYTAAYRGGYSAMESELFRRVIISSHNRDSDNVQSMAREQ
jgi:hypothetical protein